VSLRLIPITLRQAYAFIEEHHRHHKPPRGHKFSIGVADENGTLVGVACVGRPVSRHQDDGFTIEVNRTATDGSFNTNSMLYGAAWRAAKAMGYLRAITYTQEGESGASLRAAGWVHAARRRAEPNGWSREDRQRPDHGVDGIERKLWEIKR
jgi:hypothetical protein